MKSSIKLTALLAFFMLATPLVGYSLTKYTCKDGYDSKMEFEQRWQRGETYIKLNNYPRATFIHRATKSEKFKHDGKDMYLLCIATPTKEGYQEYHVVIVPHQRIGNVYYPMGFKLFKNCAVRATQPWCRAH